MKVSIVCIGGVERGIAPPLRLAVTMPIEIDGSRDANIVVYVGTSAFSAHDSASPQFLNRVAHEIAAKFGKAGE